MFSPTLIMGNSARCWNTMFTGRRLGGTPCMDAPLMTMSPASGAMKPATMRSKVVLPQPEGPRMEKKEPERTPKLRSSTAANAP